MLNFKVMTFLPKMDMQCFLHLWSLCCIHPCTHLGQFRTIFLDFGTTVFILSSDLFNLLSFRPNFVRNSRAINFKALPRGCHPVS